MMRVGIPEFPELLQVDSCPGRVPEDRLEYCPIVQNDPLKIEEGGEIDQTRLRHTGPSANCLPGLFLSPPRKILDCHPKLSWPVLSVRLDTERLDKHP